MRVGIISDTHDNIEAVEQAIETFQQERVETVLHCGDFIAPLIIPYLEGFSVHGVLGNNDGEVTGLREAFNELEDGQLHGRVATLSLDGYDIAAVHGEEMPVVNALVNSGSYDYVFYGHYHTRDHRLEDGTVVVNPGAHFPTTAEEDRTIAILDTEDESLEFHPII